MASLNITEYSSKSSVLGAAKLNAAIAYQKKTIGTVVTSDAFNARTKYIRVVADAACYIKSGANATTSHTYIPANVPEYFEVSPGDTLSVIAAA